MTTILLEENLRDSIEFKGILKGKETEFEEYNFSVKIHKDGSVLESRMRTQFEITINIWSDYFKVKFCKYYEMNYSFEANGLS